MTLSQRQQQLIQQISTIHDEDILVMLEEELSYHLKAKIELSKELSSEDLNELIMQANEPSDENIESLDDFRKATDRWRTKS